MEIHTFDYTYIINDLCSYICNKGFEDITAEVFLHVSDIDHDVLLRAIVEDKMDHQKCSISQLSFSIDIQKILTEQNHDSEVQFVYYNQNWF